MSEGKILLGMDFGGTKLAAGAVLQGESLRLDRLQCPSPLPKSAERDLEAMVELARRLLERSKGALGAIGVSFGGPVDVRQGIVLMSHHVPGWERFRLKQHLQDIYEVPVAVDNDVNVAARGEWAYGAGRGCQNFFYVNVGTGIGGGLVLGGRPYGGATGVAGEIGHTVIRSDGPLCTCGRRGCVESLAAGPYVALAAKQKLELDPENGTILRELTGGSSALLTAETVCRAAEGGDVLAQEVLENAATALGVGIGNAINLLNPDRIVLGGGVTNAGEAYWRTVREVAQVNVLPGTVVNIVPSALGDDASLWGGIHLAKQLLADEPI